MATEWRGTPYERAVHRGLSMTGLTLLDSAEVAAVLNQLDAAGLLLTAERLEAILAPLHEEIADRTMELAAGNFDYAEAGRLIGLKDALSLILKAVPR